MISDLGDNEDSLLKLAYMFVAKDLVEWIFTPLSNICQLKDVNSSSFLQGYLSHKDFKI